MDGIQILIVDYGSQYTLVIGRTLRELGVRSIILPSEKAEIWLKENNPKSVILSGSNWSVYSENAPKLPASLDTSGAKYVVLGICYGMQLLAYTLGGNVDRPLGHREYGPAKVKLKTSHPLFIGVAKETEVWASHGDTVTKIPEGFESIAISEGIAGMTDKNNRVLGVQFHPEVTDTKEGKKILQNFINLAHCVKDWDPKDLIVEMEEEVKRIVGEKNKVVLGVSGGVDSTVLAGILAPALGERLVCLAIDTGGLREGEMEELKKNVTSAGVKKISIVDAKADFLENIGKTIDAEEKREKFREVYKKVFEAEILKHKAKFIAQGTLATDIIESGQVGESAMIKTHHNVGLGFEVDDLHPLRHLFKYEVRELGKTLGLPESVYNRAPFPGPGLYLRVVGTPVDAEKMALVREADAKVREILVRHNLDKQISQLIVAMLGINSVGVKGDERVYGHSLAVRAVQTVDFMTAKGYHFPPEVADEITSALIKHKDIVRVFFDMTPKPPATTEFE
ncbi:hypothetical protein A2733_01350 [Candidatus Nomurabacteria bacterium RIFCSPHIGHO2_01_FULL_40_20]|uniref:GMP synthase (glutamine-hydrolyzing) n=1 Tax=Candidatus Nomurabacteria bacterium RIFCSPHIGHO2_01_FULL_40_20 TaxID=1801738 RepID=A0A1F6V4R4_9BACT|nr:MAG: hypothetical protein A2733_01350 [Candidatus Nomurabacteria bacterium RIFCSPHIGHO2_01_FULL_40_20]